jgi:hypothetical protein
LRDEECGIIRFIAKDVCQILELDDTSKAISRLDDDEKLIRTLFVSGQNRDIWTITESGLYSLIFTSRKSVARRFKKFITSVVIPEIRKTGSYKNKNHIQSEIRALFVREMPSTWEKVFPLELFELFCDLKGWQYQKGIPSYTNAMKHLVSKYIYGVLPKEVMEMIYEENYGRSSKLHQWLTDEMAKEIVKTQIIKVIALLRASKNWNSFEVLFNQCNYGQQALLDAKNL